MDESEVQAWLAGRFDDVFHVTTYIAYRGRGDGTAYKVTVRILDAGAAAGSNRWTVEAEDEFGNVACCNPAGTLALALGTTHWNELGRPTGP